MSGVRPVGSTDRTVWGGTLRRFVTWDRLLVAAVLLWTVIAFEDAYAHHFAVMTNPVSPQWWDWADQGRYYEAAKAWANLSLDPARHWYFAGYPLLGALMVPFMPGDPFVVPDLACLLILGVLVMQLSVRLSTQPTIGRVVGALMFLVTVAMTRYELKSFVEPWSTTPIAPLTVGAILLTLRLWDRPSAVRAAAVGLCTASVVLFRPTDTLPLGLALALVTLVALRQLPGRRLLRLAGGGLAGAAVPVALAGVTYLAVFGPHESLYLLQSSRTGFDWRLIPLHWVALFVSPMPAFLEFSMAQTFVWIIPGAAGMAACVVATRGRARLQHVLVITALSLHTLLYLSYRDLHPQGLFRYGNYHYFKWCLPVLGLYAALLVTEIVGRRHRVVPWAAGALVCLALFSWRMDWRQLPAPWLAQARIEDPHTLLLPEVPTSLMDGIFIPVDGGFTQIYLASHVMQFQDRRLHANADFKTFPTDGGLLLMMLRTPPPGPAAVHFEDDVTLRPQPPLLVTAHLFMRWPRVGAIIQTYCCRWLMDGSS